MTTLSAFFVAIGGFIVGLWASLRSIIVSLIFKKTRISEQYFDDIYRDIYRQKRKIVFNEEYNSGFLLPNEFSSFFYIKSLPWFHVSRNQKQLKTGNLPFEFVNHVSCLRWNWKKLKKYFEEKLQDKEKEVDIHIFEGRYWSAMGTLDLRNNYYPLLPKEKWKDIDEYAENIFEKKKIKKGGIILYGDPGGGKTYFVKYLAAKYKADIFCLNLEPSISNRELLTGFSYFSFNSKKEYKENISYPVDVTAKKTNEKRFILLLEDFDSHFDGRTPIGKEPDYTFDVFLNVFDGIYSDYKQILFIVTANDINKIDSSLKNRPSRFKYVRKFESPDINERENIFKDKEWAKATDQMSLDEVLFMNELKNENKSIDEALKIVKWEKNN